MPLLNPSLKLIAKCWKLIWDTCSRMPNGFADYHGVLEGHRKIGRLIIPKYTKGDAIEAKLDGTQSGFCRARSTTEEIFILQQFSRNLGSMPKTYRHVSSTSGKCMAGFLVKSFGGCCGSTVLTGASCWPSNKCIPAQKIVPVSTELNYNRSLLGLDSDNGLCCHYSSS